MHLHAPALSLLALALQAPGDHPRTSVATAAPAPAVPAPKKGLHRFMVVRTFPPKALQGLDADAKANVNKTNAKFGVRWVHSFANADLTKTYCVYEGPSAQAVKDAADANHITADSIMEIPNVLTAK